jgi:hypothetical protein
MNGQGLLPGQFFIVIHTREASSEERGRGVMTGGDCMQVSVAERVHGGYSCCDVDWFYRAQLANTIIDQKTLSSEESRARRITSFVDP